MEKKKFFWQRKKDYYEFPLGLRILGGIWSVVWTTVKVALGAGLVALTVVLLTGGIFACLLGNYLQEDVIPNADFNVEDFALDRSSFIYFLDSQNNIQKMQQIYADIDRVWVSYEDIPKDLIHAAVAIEDKRFFQHQGVDWLTTTKACINMFLGGGSTFGGSTITQQLIKNLTTEDDVTVRRKVLEIFRALQFEDRYTKEEVLEWYLNTIYLGEGCAGVQSAARTYFGKDVSNLTTAECASLISVTNNPSLYDPYISMERNRKRQLIVLSEMQKQGYLSEEEYQAAVDQDMIFTSVSLSDELFTCTNCGFQGNRSSFEYVQEDERYQCPMCGTVVDIPEFRLPKALVREEIKNVEALGVKIETNVVVGRSISLDELMEEEGFDAVFVGSGAGLPNFQKIPGENLCGVYSANEFLTRINLMKAYEFPETDTPIRVGKNAAVIGGGNVAMDAARCAKRLGAENVYIVYRRGMAELPARKEEVEHAEEEGIIFKTLTNPTEVLGDENGWVKGMTCVEMELGEPDASGRRRPIVKEGSEFVLDVDTMIMALGTSPNPLIRSTTPGLDADKHGCLITNGPDGLTSRPMVYAGGDAVTGAATVILAMGAGKKGAAAIDAYLQK